MVSEPPGPADEPCGQEGVTGRLAPSSDPAGHAAALVKNYQAPVSRLQTKIKNFTREQKLGRGLFS